VSGRVFSGPAVGAIQEKRHIFERRGNMGPSTYNIVQLVGTSDKSWEEAAKTAVETASGTLRDLRVAEVTKLDMTVEKGKVKLYRARVNLSFKYEG
jgi:flavin-binding protein dodecin